VWIPQGYNNNTTKIKVVSHICCKYIQQGKERTCLFKSLASALYYISESREGFDELEQLSHEIANPSKNLLEGDFFEQLNWVKRKILSHTNIFCTHAETLFSAVVKRHKKKKYHPLRVNPKVNTNNTFTLFVPLGADGDSSHAICLYNGLVFDTSLEHPMKLNQSSLDWSCNCEGGMVGVHHAVRFRLLNQTLKKNENMKRKVGKLHPHKKGGKQRSVASNEKIHI